MGDKPEIHEKSLNETVGQFFTWMARKAKNDGAVIHGRIGETVYEIGPDDMSIGAAFDKYLETLSPK